MITRKNVLSLFGSGKMAIDKEFRVQDIQYVYVKTFCHGKELTDKEYSQLHEVLSASGDFEHIRFGVWMLKRSKADSLTSTINRLEAAEGKYTGRHLAVKAPKAVTVKTVKAPVIVKKENSRSYVDLFIGIVTGGAIATAIIQSIN